jgi:hypothetical protein
VQLPNGRFALAPHLFLKFVYQQYDIKAQRRDGIFKYCDVVADLSEMVFKAKGKLCQRGKLDSVKMRFATFPQNGERCHCRMDQQCRFVVEGRLWGPLENAASIISF